MNELVVRQQEQGLSISTETKELIQSSIADSTLKRYQRLSKQMEAWLDGQVLNDGRLADYITELYIEGKSPATIAQVVAAAKWLAKNHGIEIVGEVTSKTLAGIRREGKDRGKGQVDGVEREEMLRVVTLAEADKTIAGLRDAALIRLMSDCLLRISEAVAVNVGDLHKSTLPDKIVQDGSRGSGRGLVYWRSHTEVDRSLYDQSEYRGRGVVQAYQAWGSCPEREAHHRLSSADYPSPCQSCGRRRIHQWSFAQGRQRCLACSGGGFGRRYAERGQVEVATDARALCQSGAGGTGSGRKVLLWEGEVNCRKSVDIVFK